MILSHREIEAHIKAGDLKFSPELESGQIGPVSIDLRLGFKITQLDSSPAVEISVAHGLEALPSGLWRRKELKTADELGNAETLLLRPGEFILGMTYETITLPRSLVGHVEGRSSYARVGLSMHQTAPWIHPGWVGQITLEIKNHGPWNIRLQPLKDRPCQLTLFHLQSPVSDQFAYGARKTDVYQYQQNPFPTKKG